jgi:hypothetical protein
MDPASSFSELIAVLAALALEQVDFLPWP